MGTLKLNVDNLYADGTLVTLPNGSVVLNREKIKYEPSSTDERHTVLQGETLTGITYKKYNTVSEDCSKYWWIIADVNNIQNPLDISEYVGQEIIIPDFLKTMLL